MHRELNAWVSELDTFKSSLAASKSTQTALEHELKSVKHHLSECQIQLTSARAGEVEAKRALIDYVSGGYAGHDGRGVPPTPRFHMSSPILNNPPSPLRKQMKNTVPSPLMQAVPDHRDMPPPMSMSSSPPHQPTVPGPGPLSYLSSLCVSVCVYVRVFVLLYVYVYVCVS